MPSKSIKMGVLGIVFSFVWSSAFIAGKYGLRYANPIDLLIIRFAIAGTIIILASVMINFKSTFSGKTLVGGIILGTLNNAIYLGLTFKGLEYISPSLTVLIVSTAPFMTLIINTLFKEALQATKIVGLIIGFCGVYLVVSTRLNSAHSTLGIVISAIGTLSFVIGAICYKKLYDDTPIFILNGWQSIFGAIFLIPFSHDLFKAFYTMNNIKYLSSVIYLSIIVSIGAMLLWFYLIQAIGPLRATAFHFLNPVFGIIQAKIMFNEAISPTDVIGTMILSFGLYIVNKTNHKNEGYRHNMRQRHSS